MPHSQHHAVAGSGEELVGLFEGRGHGLFHHQVEAALEHLAADLPVHGGGHGEHHGLHLVEQLLQAAAARGAVLGGQRRRHLGPQVVDPSEVRRLELGEDPHVVPAQGACAHDARPQRACRALVFWHQPVPFLIPQGVREPGRNARS